MLNKTKTAAERLFVGAPVGLCAMFAALTACEGDVTPDKGDPSSDAVVLASMDPEAANEGYDWEWCGNVDEQCTFTGVRRVKFGTYERYVVRSFDGGADCTADAFGSDPAPGEPKWCFIDVGETPASSPPPDGGQQTVETGEQTTNADHEQGGSAARQCPAVVGSLPAARPGSDSMLVASVAQSTSPSDTGAFRNPCGFSHMSYDDPLVFPGLPNRAPLQTYFGNTGADAFSTASSLRATGSSTCRGGIANRSSYWVPTLLNNGVPMVPTSSIFSYKAGFGVPEASAKVRKIPGGLRMIAGSASTTTLQTDAQVSWGCENHHVGDHPQIVDCAVGDSLQMVVAFPQCWNGTDLDSPDHRSHMAYPSQGACPATHPVLLPQVTFQVRWLRTPELDVAALRLASDCQPSLPGGYSVHASWFEGWDPSIRDTFVQRCINPGLECQANLLGDGRELYDF